MAIIIVYPRTFGLNAESKKLEIKVRVTKVVQVSSRKVDEPVIEAYIEDKDLYPVEIYVSYDELYELYRQINEVLRKNGLPLDEEVESMKFCVRCQACINETLSMCPYCGAKQPKVF